jgi:hypothetical protein
MNEPINNQHKIDEHYNQQLQLIERTIKALLEGVSLQDLTTSQRLNFAAKMLSPYVRMLALQYTRQHAQQPATEEDAFFAELRQQLRLSLEEVTIDASPSHTHLEE